MCHALRQSIVNIFRIKGQTRFKGSQHTWNVSYNCWICGESRYQKGRMDWQYQILYSCRWYVQSLSNCICWPLPGHPWIGCESACPPSAFSICWPLPGNPCIVCESACPLFAFFIHWSLLVILHSLWVFIPSIYLLQLIDCWQQSDADIYNLTYVFSSLFPPVFIVSFIKHSQWSDYF